MIDIKNVTPEQLGVEIAEVENAEVYYGVDEADTVAEENPSEKKGAEIAKDLNKPDSV